MKGGSASRSRLLVNAKLAGAVVLLGLLPSRSVSASDPPPGASASRAAESSEKLTPPVRVDVRAIAGDAEIRRRLQRVLAATDWFEGPQVRVEEGVVVLTGRAYSQEVKDWAKQLASNTQDVLAVVNKMEVVDADAWNLAPAWSGARQLWRDFVGSLPLLVLALAMFALSAAAGFATTRLARRMLRTRVRARLLQSVLARSLGLLIVVGGAYLVLRVAGLTQLALTVVGGTGLIGLVLGIAFRDITENFLASIFLSVQRPFEIGDLVEVAGSTGYVQQLNMRTTVLMTLEGSILQVPNATVYKSILRNYTSNVNRREDFVIGIGYEDSIDRAQEVARKVLDAHPAILRDPEPLVLADSLGKATVNLRVCFWLDGSEHSWLKVRSSAIRLVKRAFQEHGISMPDEAREIIFPQGVPVTLQQADGAPQDAPPPRVPSSADTDGEEDAACTKAEAGLSSESDALRRQARQARPLEDHENLLQAPRK